jgi:hypothetical protein
MARIESIKVVEQSTDNPYLGDTREEYDVSLRVTLNTGHWFFTPRRLTRNVAACPGFAIQTISGEDPEWFEVGKLPEENTHNGYNWERSQSYRPLFQKGDWITIKGTEQPSHRLNRVKRLG